MTNDKTKLELTWVGKDERVRLEPRVFVEAPSKSSSASHNGVPGRS